MPLDRVVLELETFSSVTVFGDFLFKTPGWGNLRDGGVYLYIGSAY